MRFLPRRPLWRALLALLVVIVGVAVAAAVILTSKPGNVSHPQVAFTAPKQAATTKPAHKKTKGAFSWSWYGYTAGRTRDFLAPADLRPPLHVGWSFHTGALLEFPPSIEGDQLFFLDDSGIAHDLNARTGKTIWTRKVGSLAAASPAIDAKAGLVFMPTLSDHSHSPGGGRFVALSMKTGKVRWSRALPSGSESSPIVSGDAVFFGDAGGTMYALDISDGHTKWTFKAGGAIKAGAALWHGNLYFGDYSGHCYAVRAANGHKVWAVLTKGADDGLRAGTFYATPTVAYGRVYVGNTDGRMYSFAARTGKLAWATATGGYVYSSAAVADPSGVGPTVYAGSYDGDFYAFNARSGKVRWRHPAGGKISGSAIVIGNVVYYSDLATHTTAGLNVRTGERQFSFDDGAFTPAVADEHAVFLIGQGAIYEMLPGARKQTSKQHGHHQAKQSHGHRAKPKH